MQQKRTGKWILKETQERKESNCAVPSPQPQPAPFKHDFSGKTYIQILQRPRGDSDPTPQVVKAPQGAAVPEGTAAPQQTPVVPKPNFTQSGERGLREIPEKLFPFLFETPKPWKMWRTKINPGRALDLFSGSGAVGRTLSAKGFEVTSLDIDKSASPTICANILEWDYEKYPPTILE